MEQDAVGNDDGLLKLLNDSDEKPRSAVNSVVLDYYKKFGRKRDLEQYFSLSTAQSDIRDPRSLFWRRMKEQSDTSDSGEKKSEESSNEICRISIKCSIPGISEVDKGDSQSNNDSESPPIITDALPMPSPSADESMDDDHSQKSGDGTLDTSVNKPLSPTSSITSQRKLEWDSLADVGYGNESDRKTSATSLSTLEREVLAQKQQYTLDYKQNSDLGLPTAHSTPVDPNDDKSKGKKGQGKKTISISRKDVDFVEVSVPCSVENAQPINVNLTKQFSVNLQQDGGFTVDNVKKDVTISPEKNIADAQLQTSVKIDKEIQTSLLRSKDKNSVDCAQEASTSAQKTPILISLNALRWKQRRKKLRNPRTKVRTKKKFVIKKMAIHEKDKSGEQVSEAESFEYMPGHIYNQNQLQQDPNTPRNNNVGNKSSLESSAVHTTDSSKESKYSFSKDLDKTINVLKLALKEKYDSKLKKKLVTEIINRLLKSNFGDGEQTPDFLSVLSLASRKSQTTSTSEADNTDNKVVHSKPKKSILRVNKFDANYVASNSQSAPNLTSVVNSDQPVKASLSKVASSTTTETDLSNNSAKDVTSSDTVFARTSSEELYKKYIDALKREEAYKQHLRDKQLFLRQKQVRSETAAKVPMQVRANNKLQELIKDLTRNNYDDGSGDASKLEGGSSSNFDADRQRLPRKHRSHSVFTLSSGNSDIQHRSCLKNKLQEEINSPRAGPSNQSGNLVNRPVVTDSSVQVNLHEEPMSHNAPTSTFTEEAKYVCLCTEKTIHCPLNPDEVMVYKCPITKSKTSTIHQPTCNIQSTSSSMEDDANTRSRPKKQRTIMECTRCLQTKISVLPNISDPSVSDVNIIKSADCVKLINELYRKVSQSTSECQCSNEKEDSHSNTCKSSKDYIRQHKDDQDNLMEDDGNELAPLVGQQVAEQNVAQTCVGCQKIYTNQPESVSDNIVIPIQGTNMMLKVSIGGKPLKIQDEQMPKETLDRKDIQDKEVVTDTIKTSLKGTSIFDECSKFVQAENPAHINKDTNIGPPLTTIRRNSEKERRSMFTKNAHDFTGDRSKWTSNTYPKKVQISDKKPFLRSNTDTGSLAANSAIQTYTIFKDTKTQPCFHTEIGQDLSLGKHSKYEEEHATQATPSIPGTSGNSNYSSGDKSQSSKRNKDKYSAELKETEGYEMVTEEEKPRDLILDVIKDITKRYSKKDTDKRRKKKCFKEIMTALSYLLDTDDSGDGDQEYSKKSQSSKSPREQSIQSEFVVNRLLNEAESNKFASCQKSGNSPRLARKSNKFINPQSSTRDTSERNIKAESWDRESTQNRRRNKAGGEKSEMASSESEPAVPKSTCDKRCGCDGSTECEYCMRQPSAKTGTCSSDIESSRSEKNKTKSALNRETLLRTTDLEADSSGKESRRFEKQEAKNVTGPCEKKSVPIRYESGCNSRNKDKSTCDISCGCDGSADCKDCVERHSPRHRVGRSGEESSRPIYQEAKCGSPKRTKNTCDETVTQTIQTDSGSRCKDSARPEKHRRPESPKNKKLHYDKFCGCDGSNECGDCVDRHSRKYGIDKCTIESVRTKKQEKPCSPKKTKTTCLKSCDCDGSEECRDCMGLNSPYETDKSSKNSARSKKQEERCASPNKTKITRDKCCCCDGFEECQGCMRPNSPKYGTERSNKLCTRTKKQERSNSPKITKVFACDKCCDCDDLEEFHECMPSVSQKYVIDRCNKEPARPKKQASRCNSPKKTKTTCDKCCGCDDLGECKDCTEPHSLKHKSGRCGMEPMKSTKQAESKSPTKIKSTSDKCCGCDDPSESEECVETQPKYVTCRNRSNSPNRAKRTCDKGCGPDSNLQDKENFNCKKQDARCNSSKKFVNRCVQSTVKRVKSLYSHSNDSSEIASSDQPCCSTDSPTVKLVNKIKKECDKYQKRCKTCKGCQASCSSAVSCEHCKRHYRWHKCRCHRTRSTENKKKCVAYNLIVQTSDSVISEDIVFDRCRPLQNVIVKVPKLKQENVPFKEACAKIEQRMPFYSNRFEPKEPKGRSQSWPNECGISSTDDVKMAKQCTVREYLEKNRPDFVDRCGTRQNCIRMISESRARERSELREQMVGLGTLQSLNDEELMYLAKELGFGRRRPLQQKIISEREMKKHSEKIYKSLPEVIQKKEDAKKESIRKTNLLMANIFKKNLQKKTLSGDVNISNYNQVVKI